ncbi:MAG TPA: hypothetical protein VKQ36_03585, partial [Ktedonobacterales bacterium]|nr:hypothetical protein [Ktedonobacterales bacterium]
NQNGKSQTAARKPTVREPNRRIPTGSVEPAVVTTPRALPHVIQAPVGATGANSSSGSQGSTGTASHPSSFNFTFGLIAAAVVLGMVTMGALVTAGIIMVASLASPTPTGDSTVTDDAAGEGADSAVDGEGMGDGGWGPTNLADEGEMGAVA